MPMKHGLIKETDDIYEMKFYVPSFKILIGDEIIELKNYCIGDFSIENDYEGALHPLFKVRIMTTKLLSMRLTREKARVRFQMEVLMYERDISSGVERNKDKNIGTTGIGEKRNVKNAFKFLKSQSFSPIGPQAASDVSEDMIVNIYKVNRDDINNHNVLTDMTEFFEVYLFNDNNVNGIMKESNLIIENSNPTQMMTYFLETSNQNNVLMTPYQNATTYPLMVFPSRKIIEHMFYIDRAYGIYSRGAMIFFGLERTYILNIFAGRCSAWATGEDNKETTILVQKLSSPGSDTPAMVNRAGEKVFYMLINGNEVNASNNTYVTNVTDGTMANVINSEKQTTTKTSRATLAKGPTQFQKTIYNDTDNPFLGTMLAQKLSSDKTVLTMTLSNINPEALYPNKLLKVVYEDQKLGATLNGLYAVIKTKLIFRKEGDEYRLAVLAKLRKYDK